jgi:hypothetical protein
MAWARVEMQPVDASTGLLYKYDQLPGYKLGKLLFHGTVIVPEPVQLEVGKMYWWRTLEGNVDTQYSAIQGMRYGWVRGEEFFQEDLPGYPGC